LQNCVNAETETDFFLSKKRNFPKLWRLVGVHVFFEAGVAAVGLGGPVQKWSGADLMESVSAIVYGRNLKQVKYTRKNWAYCGE
jgi:hypothetical protein